MEPFHSLGLHRPFRPAADPAGPTHVVRHGPLHRVLAFTGFSIHDVINDPIARNIVAGYFKLHRQVWRRCEIVDLERWWNNTGRS
jgi:hypothetical protein